MLRFFVPAPIIFGRESRVQTSPRDFNAHSSTVCPLPVLLRFTELLLLRSQPLRLRLETKEKYTVDETRVSSEVGSLDLCEKSHVGGNR